MLSTLLQIETPCRTVLIQFAEWSLPLSTLGSLETSSLTRGSAVSFELGTTLESVSSCRACRSSNMNRTLDSRYKSADFLKTLRRNCIAPWATNCPLHIHIAAFLLNSIKSSWSIPSAIRRPSAVCSNTTEPSRFWSSFFESRCPCIRSISRDETLCQEGHSLIWISFETLSTVPPELQFQYFYHMQTWLCCVLNRNIWKSKIRPFDQSLWICWFCPVKMKPKLATRTPRHFQYFKGQPFRKFLDSELYRIGLLETHWILLAALLFAWVLRAILGCSLETGYKTQGLFRTSRGRSTGLRCLCINSTSLNSNFHHGSYWVRATPLSNKSVWYPGNFVNLV